MKKTPSSTWVKRKGKSLKFIIDLRGIKLHLLKYQRICIHIFKLLHMLGHIIFKISKNKGKEKILKAAREKRNYTEEQSPLLTRNAASQKTIDRVTSLKCRRKKLSTQHSIPSENILKVKVKYFFRQIQAEKIYYHQTCIARNIKESSSER